MRPFVTRTPGMSPTDPRSLFAGRVALVATRQAKDLAIGPVLLRELGVQVLTYVPTETFPTVRSCPGTLPDAVRAKARLAFERVPAASLVVAEAGVMAPAAARGGRTRYYEVVLLADRRADGAPHEFMAGLMVTSRAVQHATVRTVADACAVAPSLGFPEHALMVRTARATAGGAPSPRARAGHLVAQGIVGDEALIAAVTWALESAGGARLEVDWQAHLNPTRMQVIARATEALTALVRSACLVCGHPGFGPAFDGDFLRALRTRATCSGCGHSAPVPPRRVDAREAGGHETDA